MPEQQFLLLDPMQVHWQEAVFEAAPKHQHLAQALI